MMVMVMYVVLTGSGVDCNRPISCQRLIRYSTPDTKASARRKGFRASGTGASWLFWLASSCEFLRDRAAARHSMNRFDGRRHGLGIWLRPAEIIWELLEKLVDLFTFDGLVRHFLRFRIGQLGIVLAQWDLIGIVAIAMAIAMAIAVAIVGEFAR
jgi:hypothetical protein